MALGYIHIHIWIRSQFSNIIVHEEDTSHPMFLDIETLPYYEIFSLLSTNFSVVEHSTCGWMFLLL